MSDMSKALLGMMAREYEQRAGSDQLEAGARIAPAASAADHVRLGLVQLLLPELVAAVEKVIVQSTDNVSARGMAGGLLSYVCNPLDIIGDDMPLGRVDDALICALGLERLRSLHRVELGPRTDAVCRVAADCLGYLSTDLQHSIEDFVSELERSTRAKAAKE